jgi:hypothetical protein
VFHCGFCFYCCSISFCGYCLIADDADDALCLFCFVRIFALRWGLISLRACTQLKKKIRRTFLSIEMCVCMALDASVGKTGESIGGKERMLAAAVVVTCMQSIYVSRMGNWQWPLKERYNKGETKRVQEYSRCHATH